MTEAQQIIETEDGDTYKKRLADFQSERSVTHSEHMKDWFFCDGSVLRFHAGQFYDITQATR